MNKKIEMLMVFLYLFAIVSANLSVAYFGKRVVILNAFLMIGLIITFFDELHTRWKARGVLFRNTFLLILSGSVITTILNLSSHRVAIASLVAFTASNVIDRIVYELLDKKEKFFKINLSNIFSSISDSLLFVVIAFGFDARIVILQSLAKIFGGLVWSMVIVYGNRFVLWCKRNTLE